MKTFPAMVAPSIVILAVTVTALCPWCFANRVLTVATALVCAAAVRTNRVVGAVVRAATVDPAAMLVAMVVEDG
jgi:hypothetical protein